MTWNSRYETAIPIKQSRNTIKNMMEAPMTLPAFSCSLRPRLCPINTAAPILSPAMANAFRIPKNQNRVGGDEPNQIIFDLSHTWICAMPGTLKNRTRTDVRIRSAYRLRIRTVPVPSWHPQPFQIRQYCRRQRGCPPCRTSWQLPRKHQRCLS